MKLFSLFHKKHKVEKQRGFTLIELVLYVGILSILLGVVATIFGQILDVQLSSESTSTVDQDGRYILAKLTHDFQSSSPIVFGSTMELGASSTILNMNLNRESTDTVYSLDSSGNLILTNIYGTNTLNSVYTRISNLSFRRLGLDDSKDTVQINFTVTSRIPKNNSYESRSFQSTFASHNHPL